MGLTSSKEQLMVKTIENQDIDALKILADEAKREGMQILCKTLVPKDENQCTILHFATWQDNPQVLEMLLEYADDLEIRDGLGWTPLMTAVNRNSVESVKILLKHGAKINCDTVKGIDLIATAMSFNNKEIVKLLMDNGAQITSSADNECHLLHFAADDGLTDIAKLLLDKGKIPINTTDQSGWTALHLAAGHNHYDIVKLLLENGADVNIKDQQGNTPLAWAREAYANDAIEELEKHGGIADEEWHGERLMLSNHELLAEGDEELYGFDNHQFEIDESIEDNVNIPDALQRQ